MKKAEAGVFSIRSAAVAAAIAGVGLFGQLEAKMIFGSVGVENWPERIRCRCEVPIAGASVYLKIPDTSRLIGGEGYRVIDSTVSDERGMYRFSSYRTKVRISAEASGFRGQSITLEAKSDSIQVAYMRLVPETVFAGFSGGVYRENVSHPVPGCTVMVSMFYNDRGTVGPYTSMAITSATGKYSITGIPVTANFYPVTLSVKGLVPTRVDTFALVNTQRHVDLYAGAAPGITVSGVVERKSSDKCGKCGLRYPIANARVYVLETSEMGASEYRVQYRDSAVTDARGEWSITGFPKNDFEISVTAAGYHPNGVSVREFMNGTMVSIQMEAISVPVVHQQSASPASQRDAIVVDATGRASLILSAGRTLVIETYGLDGRLLAPARTMKFQSGTHQLALSPQAGVSPHGAVIVRVSGSGLLLTKRVVALSR